MAVLLVISSGLIHAVWNLFTKQSVNKAVFLWFCQWAAIVIFAPFTINELATSGHSFPISGLILLCLSALLHAIYVLLLSKTYSIGDFSQVYPIMRGTSPLLVPLIGVCALREHLSMAGWIGVLCIVSGIFIIGGFGTNRLNLLLSKPALMALAVGLTITGYTVLDKLTLRYIPPFTVNEASNIANMIALTFSALQSGALQPGALQSGAIRHEWRLNWKTIFLGGVLAPGGYILFLHALRIMPVAQVAPIREIGTVFGTLLGVVILREPQGFRRIGAAMLIILGVMLLA